MKFLFETFKVCRMLKNMMVKTYPRNAKTFSGCENFFRNVTTTSVFWNVRPSFGISIFELRKVCNRLVRPKNRILIPKTEDFGLGGVHGSRWIHMYPYGCMWLRMDPARAHEKHITKFVCFLNMYMRSVKYTYTHMNVFGVERRPAGLRWTCSA